jgi:PiT family inorganic phosphate transporter
MLSLLGGIFLGWSLGANDAANAFGPAVTSRMLKYWSAAVVAAVFVLLGALAEGQAPIETLKSITTISLKQAVVSSVAAAATVTLMTLLGFPVSTSQAVVGAIMGIGFMNRQLDMSEMSKVLICWFGTPVGGLLIAAVLLKTLGRVYNRLTIDLFQSDILLRVLLIGAGSYAAYALGANNVANVTAVFVGAGHLNIFWAKLIGGQSIACGILTFSLPVMETVGKKLVPLDPFSALIVVLAEAITVHLYTLVGVPVSTSQALIGAVLGVGLIKGINTVSRQTMGGILLAWFLTPTISCFISISLYFVVNLRYVPSG